MTFAGPVSFEGSFAEIFIENTGSRKSIFALQGDFIQFLTLIYDAFKDKNLEAENIAARDDLLIHQCLAYMEEYYPDQLQVNELAGSLNISYRHLARIFKRVTGITIIDKLNDIRIGHAKRLLMETNMTVSQIADIVGFDNTYYFSNVFKKHTYISPTGFRKKYKQI